MSSKKLIQPQYHELASQWKELLSRGLQDDGAPWDWTSLGSVRSRSQKIRARVIAKAHGVWAAEGLGWAANSLSETKLVHRIAQDGTRVSPGSVVAELHAPAMLVLAYERPFLNLASYAGGIASRTALFVEQIRGTKLKNPPRLTSTRKTLPGYRDIAVHAVRCGGGFSHRVSLSGGVLIKENHIAAAGGIRKAVVGVRASAPHGLKIEVEVRSLQELREALAAEVDGVLLDNFSVQSIRTALSVVSRQNPSCLIEVSGGITLETVSDYAIEGVHVISVGSLTHSSPALDLSLLVEGL